MARNILVATDLSDNSAFAFHYAVDMAAIHNASLVVLYVMEELPQSVRALFHGLPDSGHMATLKEDNVRRIKERLHLYCDQEREENPSCRMLDIAIEVRDGYPADEILKTADRVRCDLVVMAAHAKGFLKHTFIGSTAEKVLKRSWIPLLIVPFPENAKVRSIEASYRDQNEIISGPRSV
ncbi:MAG: universal stress protein [Deltaproteobacteria bacterium]|nr:universal stress protein [Deltaproteobacteria bacterium]